MQTVNEALSGSQILVFLVHNVHFTVISGDLGLWENSFLAP